MTNATDRKAEIGVLLVHGIGEQQPGETLLNFGEPIVEWIDRWLENIGHAWTFEARENIPEPYRNYRFGEIQITRSSILPAAADVPPHVRFELRTHAVDYSAGSELKSEWLIAESRWAASFPPPNPRAVIQWTMKILPVVVASAVVPYRRFRAWRRRGSVDAQERSPLVRAAARAMIIAGMLLVGFLTSPIILTLDLLLLGLFLLTFIPIPAIQRYMDWVQFKLAAIVGDSYIFTESEIRKRAVIDRVLADLAWLEQRCKSITIVAHSQGAAVAYYTLQEKSLGNLHSDALGAIRLLVTFGSGLTKLDALSTKRRLDRDFSMGPYHALAFVGVPLAAVTALLLAFGGLSPRYVTVIAFGSVAMTFLLMGIMTVIEAPQEMASSSFGWWAGRLNESGIHWIDVYASSDPIPDGPIMVPEAGVGAETRPTAVADMPEIHEVHNRGSMFSDHTTYQTNVDEFIPLLVTSITRHSPCSVPLHELTPKDSRALAAAATLRRYRVKFLQTRRWVILLGMIAVLVNPAALSTLGAALRATLTGVRHLPVVDLVVSSGSGAIDLGISEVAAGFMVAALFYGVLLSLFTWTWKLVDSSAVTDLTWRRTPGELFVGRPTMLPDTRKSEARFVDYMLRLLPWLAASVALGFAVPALGVWMEVWLPGSRYSAVAVVLVLTLSVALVDTIVSYSRRRAFLKSFLQPASASTSVASANGG